MDFPTVVAQHERAGALSRINDTTFDVTSAKHRASATVRLLQGRATVEFANGTLPAGVPSAPVLRDQAQKYKGAFYASAGQLNEFLMEMA